MINLAAVITLLKENTKVIKKHNRRHRLRTLFEQTLLADPCIQYPEAHAFWRTPFLFSAAPVPADERPNNLPSKEAYCPDNPRRRGWEPFAFRADLVPEAEPFRPESRPAQS